MLRNDQRRKSLELRLYNSTTNMDDIIEAETLCPTARELIVHYSPASAIDDFSLSGAKQLTRLSISAHNSTDVSKYVYISQSNNVSTA